MISADILLINSSIFGIAAFLLTQASFNFLELSAIFTDLSFFMVMTAGEMKQFSVVLSAFSKCPFSINFSSSFLTVFWKCIGTGRPFCWIGFVSFFNGMSMVRSLIVWLFLNRSSYSFMIFCRLPSVSMCRIMFVFLFPCSPISNLSNQSSPNNG